LSDGSVKDEADWLGLQSKMIDAMVSFEPALRPSLESLDR